MSEKKVTVRLTLQAAKALWGIVDGAQDAGACEGGLTPQENRACTSFLEQVSPHLVAARKAGINLIAEDSRNVPMPRR
jgi:hypothetical protein